MTQTAPAQTETVSVPPAQRHRRPGWRDPRILIGLAIVCGSMLLGARLLAGADHTVAVWAARGELPAGASVRVADLVQRQVHFATTADADLYLTADQAPPAGMVLGREVGAGELVPRAALGTAPTGLVHVPVSVDPALVPSTVRQGSRVDIWVAPASGGAAGAGPGSAAQLVLRDVVVIGVPASEQGLAPSGSRQVILGVPPSVAASLGPALGQAVSGRVVITRRS